MSRKLDALVAVRVLGLVVKRGNEVGYSRLGKGHHNLPEGGYGYYECLNNRCRPVEPYSSNISAAWAVVEEWGVLPWNIDNGWREKDGERISGVTCKITTHTGSFEATEKDMPMAVCVCALRAVGVDEATIQEAMK